MNFHELPSQVAQLQFVKQKLETDNRWILRGLLTIYDHQTQDEQRIGAAKEHNGVGFTGPDSPFLTSLCQQAIRKGAKVATRSPDPINLRTFFSPAQEQRIRHKITKYAGQLCKIARSNKR